MRHHRNDRRLRDKCGYISANSAFNCYALTSVFGIHRRSLRQPRFQSLFAAFATKLPRFPHSPPVIATAMIPIFICDNCDKITSFSAFTAGHCDSSDSNIYLRNCLHMHYMRHLRHSRQKCKILCCTPY